MSEGWADIYGKAWGDKAPQVRKFLINEYKDKHVDKTGETPTEVLEWWWTNRYRKEGKPDISNDKFAKYLLNKYNKFEREKNVEEARNL